MVASLKFTVFDLLNFLTLVKHFALNIPHFTIRIVSILIGGSVFFVGSTSVADLNRCYLFYRDQYLNSHEAQKGEKLDEQFYLRSSFVGTPNPYAIGQIVSLAIGSEKKKLQFEYVVRDSQLVIEIVETKIGHTAGVLQKSTTVFVDSNCQKRNITEKNSDSLKVPNLLQMGLFVSPLKDRGIQSSVFDGRDYSFEIKSLNAIRIKSPLTQATETVNRTRFTMNGFEMTTEEFTDSQGRVLYFASILGADLNQRTDFLSKADWLQLSLDGPPQVIGADPPLIHAQSALGKISGLTERLSIEQYEYYFAIKSQQQVGNKWTAVVHFRQPQAPSSVRWDMPSTLEDHSQLRFDLQVQHEPVREIANQIRKQLSGQSRLEVAKIIGQVLQNHIRYSMKPNLGLNTSEIMASGEGNCYHFSILYTAIARSLGLPTRIRSGYVAREGALQPHAWVEIKINETDWWPFEPQSADGRFFQLGYLPLDLMKTGGDIDIKTLLQPAKRVGLGAINRFELLP